MRRKDEDRHSKARYSQNCKNYETSMRRFREISITRNNVVVRAVNMLRLSQNHHQISLHTHILRESLSNVLKLFIGHLTRISAGVVARLPVRELAVDDKPIPCRMFAPKSDKDQGLMKARV